MPVVAIVGRPNAGKSTLFNALIKDRRAIVGPQRGITRDRIYALCPIDENFVVDLVDTGGYDSGLDTEFGSSVREQTMLAIEDADLIVCVLDVRAGVTADDLELIQMLRKSDVNVIYVANKVDDPNSFMNAGVIYEVGISDFIEISALNNRGLHHLKTELKNYLQPDYVYQEEQESGAVRVSILGRPNVGKSLMLNKIIGQDRAIVSPEAGTTRDFVDFPLNLDGKNYVFVDTAGIRRKSRIKGKIERVSVMRSLRNIERSDVCLYLIEPHEGLTEQDRRLCGHIIEHGRAFVLVVNKSDLISSQESARLRKTFEETMRFLPGLKIIFVSALSGKNINKLYPVINELFVKTTTNIATPRINRIIREITQAVPPPAIKGRRIKFYYANQVGVAPPRFRIVTNYPDKVPKNYSRYLSGSIKKHCNIDGIPIKIQFVGK